MSRRAEVVLSESDARSVRAALGHGIGALMAFIEVTTNGSAQPPSVAGITAILGELRGARRLLDDDVLCSCPSCKEMARQSIHLGPLPRDHSETSERKS